MVCADSFKVTFEHPVMGLPSAENETCPSGMPPPGAVEPAVAVKITGLPNPEGFRFEESTVDVEARFTNCTSPLDVEDK